MPVEARVSVIMPVFNSGRFLAEAVESVLAQTYVHWELLLVDDGSTDDSPALARSYAEHEPERIRYLEHAERANCGPSATRNLGIFHARGDYLALLDADDVAEPQRLQRQVAFLDAHPEVGLVGSWYRETDEDGRVLRQVEKPCDCTDIRWALLFYSPFLHSSVTLRNTAVRQATGFYDRALTIAEDYDLWVRIAAVLPVANLAEPLVRYRLHPSSLIASTPGKSQAVRRVSRSGIERLLGRPAGGAHVSDAIHQSMFALVLGWANSYDVRALLPAVDELFRLQQAFCRAYALPAAECARHRRELRVLTSRRLVAFARRFRSQDPPVARALLRRAARLHWPTLLRPRNLLAVGRAAWS